MLAVQTAPTPRAVPPVAAAEPPRHEAPFETRFVWRVLEEIDYGLILVSPSGTLQHANQLARQELARARFLRIDGSRVAGILPEQTEQILGGVQMASTGRRQMITMRHGADSLPIACVPLFQPEDGHTASVLLMLARQSGTQNLALTFFSRSHGLSPAEEGVLKSLCEGLNVHEIAAGKGVSENTIRTQVRSLRDKTGMSSIRQLVQRVAALPPVVPMQLTVRPHSM